MDLALDLILPKPVTKLPPALGGGESNPAVIPVEHSCLVRAAERIVHHNADYIGLLQRQGISW